METEYLYPRCYVPYSKKTEAVVVKSKSGNLFPGVRIENISFPLTITAIQCGMIICLSEGEEPEAVYLGKNSGISGDQVKYWKHELAVEFAGGTTVDGELAEIVRSVENVKQGLSELLEQSIVPHSHFPVSTLLQTEHGFISGINVEFDAWERGLCAERTALAKAIAYGIDRGDIIALHLHSRHGEYCSPCGACRQVILEHLPKIPVIIHHPDGGTSRHLSSDLLPYSFTSDFLKKDNQ